MAGKGLKIYSDMRSVKYWLSLSQLMDETGSLTTYVLLRLDHGEVDQQQSPSVRR